jgi:hypothetical protein
VQKVGDVVRIETHSDGTTIIMDFTRDAARQIADAIHAACHRDLWRTSEQPEGMAFDLGPAQPGDGVAVVQAPKDPGDDGGHLDRILAGVVGILAHEYGVKPAFAAVWVLAENEKLWSLLMSQMDTMSDIGRVIATKVTGHDPGLRPTESNPEGK